jgi:hypothetical protein
MVADKAFALAQEISSLSANHANPVDHKLTM